jgi:phosphatidylethanolamine/phosphatidyl-N-methylethanolamine N-methyltransferase
MSTAQVLSFVKSSLFATVKQPIHGESIYFTDSYFLAAIFFAIFNPIAWNLGGRIEYHTHLLTKICGGWKYLACYIFAAYIFTIGIIRDVV